MSKENKNSIEKLHNTNNLHGIAASPGIAIGKAYINISKQILNIPKSKIDKSEINNEIERLRIAKKEVNSELKTTQEKISKKYGEEYCDIIDSQISILNDSEIEREIFEYVSENLLNIEYVYKLIISQYIELLENSKSEFFRERISDIREVKNKVLLKLLVYNETPSNKMKKDEPKIYIAKYLTPNDIIIHSSENIVGFVAEEGGLTSHVAILARTLDIPMVLGINKVTSIIKSNENIVLYANKGELIRNSRIDKIKEYREEQKKHFAIEKIFIQHKNDPTITKDGKTIRLAANINLPVELNMVKKYGGDGIGLYRTEYLYLMKNDLPTENELFHEYSHIVKELPNKEIVIRTIDLGGDKMYLKFGEELSKERNPFMGYRAIRICLDKPEIFITQLKAILRASYYGKVKLMIPMISTIEEIINTKKYIQKAKDMLSKEGKPFDENIKVGILVETPSAAFLANRLAKEIDYFSIGTNDLTQYMLAVDRGNEKINKLFCHFDPVVIAAIRWIVKGAKSNKIETTVCGEIASDPIATILLVGLGIDNLSVSPIFLGPIRTVIRNISYKESKIFANKILKMETRQEVKLAIRSEFDKKFPDWEKNYESLLK
ncbi:MAG: phosphoenolpyruvate--protein phosphotransferase [Candidatus Marinimicrobia bacterium]|jgi:phosphotransferase system enzyme I (PtsI)|nr:phosphoenolpyruvate--protein phosphotransferase [Candidatus Neomarinimicrobiota bacterium]